MPTIAFCALVACGPSTKLVLDETGLADSGAPLIDTSEPVCDPGSYAPEPVDAAWCIDFEDGLLSAVGYEGEADVTLHDGARVLALGEGHDISALRGEECVGFSGDWGLALRSNADGDTASVAIATTAPFTVDEPDLFWSVLNEVDERGIYWALDVMSAEGAVLASAVLPSTTGGHVPGLEPEHEEMADFPEIEVGLGTPGVLSEQAISLERWAGDEVKVRFYQHTASPGNGFLTLVDQICAGAAPEQSERVVLGDPLDHGV